ncbi:putative polynucleotide 5' kinase/3' phosphatase [Pectobacterium phage PhiM1]|uniref:Putative polynucleotide 5' kinase/3' phosphatase n=1 Tax=Pectobacterium phage PhiM1 TaxID=1211386 RepID=A0A1P7WG05_9CAUD|nr:polynucleotide kinase [Pectobacterium phage PhiM1]AFQ22513.1 putative polynucleotide 5' kinase/3' phosphatase [Pectobacterium phage PhiM1]
MASVDDLPFTDNIELCNALERAGYYIVVLTGRSDVAWDVTVKWLVDNGAQFNALVMRSQSDNRKDTVIKEEYLRSIGLENILCCFDDLPHVAYHLRSLGLTCHLVTHYEEQRTDLVSHGDDE